MTTKSKSTNPRIINPRIVSAVIDYRNSHEKALGIAKIQQCFSKCVKDGVKFDGMGEVKTFVQELEKIGYPSSLIREAIDALPSDPITECFLTEWDFMARMLSGGVKVYC